jgi:DNA-binding transcriptional ArsR family regulator
VAIRSFKFVTNPKAIDAVADETRRKIIYLLRAKEQTVSQLAEALGKTPQAIYHQIRKLTEAELVEVAREERVGHFIETYYRATAEVFEFRHGEPGAGRGGGKYHVTSGLQALPKIGIPVNLDKDTVEQINMLKARISDREVDPELEEKIMSLEDVDFLGKQHLYFFAKYAKMSNKEFEENIADEREIMRLLKSMTKRAGEKK